MATSVAMFFATCGMLALLGTLAQINPIWLLGPYRPGVTTAGAVPDWYMGFLDGALRIMLGGELEVAGHSLTLAVLVPVLVVPGAFFALLAATRTAAGAAGDHVFTGCRGPRPPDRPEREEAEHGRKTGLVVMTPDGGFNEVTEPVRRQGGWPG